MSPRMFFCLRPKRVPSEVLVQSAQDGTFESEFTLSAGESDGQLCLRVPGFRRDPGGSPRS